MPIKYRSFPPVTAQIAAHFWEQVQITPSGCWLWIGNINHKRRGYGRYYIHRIDYRTHRVAYWLYYNEDPGEFDVCHSCDNPPCCNPLHIWKGTRAENHKDMDAKGRRVKPEDMWMYTRPELVQRGEDRYNARFTEAQIREVRQKCANGTSQSEIGREYGTSQSVISCIIRRRTWKHVA